MTITLKENIIQKGGAAKVSNESKLADFFMTKEHPDFMNYWYTAHLKREDLIKYTTDNYNKFIVDNFKGNEDHLKSHME